MRSHLTLAAALSLLAGTGFAGDRSVYKSVDASGSVSYSDRRSGEQDARLTNWMPAPSGRAYYEGAYRAAAERAYYSRLRYDSRQPPPIAVYDPRRWQAEREQASGRADYRYPGYADSGYAGRYYGRRDFNLPDTPAPSLDRNYYYNSR